MMGFSDAEVELVVLLFHFFTCHRDQCLVGLGCVLEWIDRCRLVKQSKLKFTALETSIQVPFYELGGGGT